MKFTQKLLLSLVLLSIVPIAQSMEREAISASSHSVNANQAFENIPDEILSRILKKAILQDIETAQSFYQALTQIQNKIAVNKRFARIMQDKQIINKAIDTLMIKFPEDLMAYAIQTNHIDWIQKLLNNGLDINTRRLPSYNGIGTPLAVACESNKNNSHYKTIKFLLENGTDIHGEFCDDSITDFIDRSESRIWGKVNNLYLFLHELMKGELDTAELFLSHGFQIDCDHIGPARPSSARRHLFKKYKQCLEKFSYENYLAIIELLTRYSIRPDFFDLLDGDNSTPIHDAILNGNTHGNVEYIRLLLRCCDINFQNRDNRLTPLMTAVRAENLECVRCLIEHGADLTLKVWATENGKTAWDYAYEKGNKAIMWELFKAGGAPKWLYGTLAAGTATGIVGFSAWLFKNMKK